MLQAFYLFIVIMIVIIVSSSIFNNLFSVAWILIAFVGPNISKLKLV